MRRNKLKSPAGITLAAILVIGAAFIGWLAVQATAVEMLSARSTQISALVGDRPDFVLGSAMGGLVANRGTVKPQALPAVRDAATRVPLDARPYLLVGSDYLRAGRIDQAMTTLEAGRRLDPRQRWIHLLLLDHYLRSGKYAAAADEFAVLSRLVGSAQGPIANALAQMSIAPETRDAVRLTMRQDPRLERSVLVSLASSGVEPAVIFRMASPAALRVADAADGWGTVLVDRLVAKQRYRLAHLVWQKINRLTGQQAAPLLYDAGLAGRPGKPPFNWELASDSIAAVDFRGGKFDINYYGRDSGDLVSQLLVLPPGNYRFSYVVGGLQRQAGPTIVWAVTCANRPDRTVASAELPAAVSGLRRIAFRFSVPDGCPAQRLRLSGLAGEFPVPVSASIERLQLERLGA